MHNNTTKMHVWGGTVRFFDLDISTLFAEPKPKLKSFCISTGLEELFTDKLLQALSKSISTLEHFEYEGSIHSVASSVSGELARGGKRKQKGEVY